MVAGTRTRLILTGVALLVVVHLSFTHYGTILDTAYQSLASPTTYDRTGAVLATFENAQGHLSTPVDTYPARLKELVLLKEDQWFYYHPGLNPYRTARAAVRTLLGQEVGGASTITEQLSRTLLGYTTERTLAHKVEEVLGAFALEYSLSKDAILNRYLDTAYLGDRSQGFGQASRRYFDKQVAELSEGEILTLVATLSNPARLRPFGEANAQATHILAEATHSLPPLSAEEHDTGSIAGSKFELESMGLDCARGCATTIDNALTQKLRALLARHLATGKKDGMTHGAIVVIKVPENEILAVVGSPDPYGSTAGTSINMALETRPIGSTIKPFIYLKGFEKGLRPYTPVDDRELKFDVDGGFAIYPRNYDGAYRGSVLLDEALQNSLNVPTVEVLRYVTLPTFYEYLGEALRVAPPQRLDSYAYGIALGGLELDLMTLTQLFTALPKNGLLEPLTLRTDTAERYTPPSSRLTAPVHIADPKYVALINAILSDRAGAVDQFGASGSLYLSRDGYAVKTGTSRDYHDSWTVGYTPELVVGVWVGNAENRPMAHVSGSAGAGSIWHDSMELLFASPYYTGKQLTHEGLTRVPSSRGYSYGLPGEKASDHATLLARTNLILFPHDGDEFLFTPGMSIILSATEAVEWSGNSVVRGSEFAPTAPGSYTITATGDDGTHESVTVEVRASTAPTGL